MMLHHVERYLPHELIEQFWHESRLTHRLRNDEQHFLRVVVVTAVLGISAIFAPQVSPLLLVGIIGAFGALMFMHRPQLGLVVLIPAALLVPFEIGTGTESALHAGVLLLATLTGLWIADMLQRSTLRILPSGPIRPLLAFIGVTLLAFFAGNQPWLNFAEPASIRAQIGGVGMFILSGTAFLLVAYQVRDIKWLRWMTWVFLAIAALYIAGRLSPEVNRLTRRIIQRGADGSVFWIWALALPFAQVLFNDGLSPKLRAALIALICGVLYVALVIERGWVSGWLPPLVAVVAILWIGAPRFGMLATLFAGILGIFKIQTVINAVMIGDNEYSLFTRLEAWHILGEIIKVNPLLGVGPANYYWYTPLYSIRGYYVNFNSHNNYVDLLAQVGVIGLFCFLWFVWRVGHLGWRLREEMPSGFARAYVYGAFGGLAGMLAAGMLGDWVIPFAYNVGLRGFRASMLGWLFLGGLVALERMYARTPRTVKPERRRRAPSLRS